MGKTSLLGYIVTALKPFFDFYAWVQLVFGALLFSARVPLPNDPSINLPVLATLLQITGGMFIISGFSLVVCRLFWPQLHYNMLQRQALSGNIGAAIVLAGVKVFAGFVVLACALWLAMAFNGGGH